MLAFGGKQEIFPGIMTCFGHFSGIGLSKSLDISEYISSNYIYCSSTFSIRTQVSPRQTRQINPPPNRLPCRLRSQYSSNTTTPPDLVQIASPNRRPIQVAPARPASAHHQPVSPSQFPHMQHRIDRCNSSNRSNQGNKKNEVNSDRRSQTPETGKFGGKDEKRQRPTQARSIPRDGISTTLEWPALITERKS